ncbi:MAG: precorrin-6y C5,15-methyltransferase (decarboxylating) subunit CbiE [Eubacterium sp.]|nr:precorrin-6y C5,15-methyltransferase (decarboxylating) subunit CbiE [Eubacterium sp.]
MKKLIIAGLGPGDFDMMTDEVKRELEKSDLICGAKRLLEGFKDKPTAEEYRAEKIRPYLLSGKYENVCVLMSGDSGFYSGTLKLYEEFKDDGMLSDWDIKVLPGISSVSFLASKLKESYDDAAILNAHGRSDWQAKLVYNVRYNKKTFVLTSGKAQAEEIRSLIKIYFAGEVISIWAGENLSYPDEKIYEISDEDETGDGIITLFIKNTSPEPKFVGKVIEDDEFIRGDVPMTKQEVRQISIGKLGLFEGAVLLDLGCGTGSVAVSAAALSPNIKVYAVDINPEAVKLTKENALKHKCANVFISEGDICEYLKNGGFDMPTHAFVGGNGGKLNEIVNILREINPDITIVVNAITLETISAATSLMTNGGEAVFVQTDRNRRVGKSNMVISENRIMIVRL